MAPPFERFLKNPLVKIRLGVWYPVRTLRLGYAWYRAARREQGQCAHLFQRKVGVSHFNDYGTGIWCCRASCYETCGGRREGDLASEKSTGSRIKDEWPHPLALGLRSCLGCKMKKLGFIDGFHLWPSSSEVSQRWPRGEGGRAGGTVTVVFSLLSTYSSARAALPLICVTCWIYK